MHKKYVSSTDSQKKYFNPFEMKKIINMTYINLTEAKEKFEEYLKKYPFDYSAYFYYAISLISIGELASAQDIIFKAKILMEKDGHFKNLTEKYDRVVEDMNFALMKLYSYQGNYLEAYKICINYFARTSRKFSAVRTFLEKKLGYKPTTTIFIQKLGDDCYMLNQINEYSEEAFLRHAERHDADYNQELSDRNNCIFAVDFDVRKVFEEVKKVIPSSTPILKGFFEDAYYFKYDNCGRVNNRVTNFFTVVCFHGTVEGITMTPSQEGEYFPYTDLNYLKENSEEESKKLKIAPRQSQVDKFMARLAKKA